MCVRRGTGEGGDGRDGVGGGLWLNKSPTGGNEQAAANHIAHAHAANDDWWRGERGGRVGGLSLKGTGGLFLRSRLVCVCWGGVLDR